MLPKLLGSGARGQKYALWFKYQVANLRSSKHLIPTVSLAMRKCPVHVMEPAHSSLAVAWIQCPTLAAERRKEPANQGPINRANLWKFFILRNAEISREAEKCRLLH